MEPIEIFTATVLIVGAMHLMVTAGTSITLWWKKRLAAKDCSSSAIDAAAEQAGLLSAASSQQRSDWYVFFHCADLVGREPLEKKSKIRKDKAVSDGKRQQSTKPLPLRAGARL
jgi:hypothetical protein